MYRDLGLDYHSALHGVQSGIAYKLDDAWDGASPKHLRVGLDARAAEHGALVSLLIDKGLIDEREYLEYMRLGVNEEVARMQEELTAKHGGGLEIKLR
jgi:hypothetical protein